MNVTPRVWDTHPIGYEALAAKAIRGALESPSGLAWLLGPCGQWWVRVTELDSEVVWALATKGRCAGLEYEPLKRCPVRGRWSPTHHGRNGADIEGDQLRKVRVG